MNDSQRQQRSGATPIKNPLLLSASVTDVTFDDFPNKPLLLPAAPPIVHSHATAPVLKSSGLCSRETKSLVTVGSSSLDTENLDEINLNASNDDNQTSNATDPNANTLLDQSNTGSKADSILSQAASSFSALPSVASNVLSTFSKRLTAISSRETTPVSDQYQQDHNSNALAPQLEVQPTYNQQSQQEVACLPNSANFFASPSAGNPLSSNFDATQTNLPAAEPPKFYTPTEVPAVPSISTAPPPTLGSQNNFRFSSKKKLYAPIPGLSEESKVPTGALDPSTITTQIPYLTSETQKPKEHALSLLSKLGNIVPSGVLYQENSSQTNNFPAPPLAPNYFVPQQQTSTAYPITVASETQNPGLVQSTNESLTPAGKTDFSQNTSQFVLAQLPIAALGPATTATQNPYRTSETQKPKVHTSLLSKLGNIAPSGVLYQENSSHSVFEQQTKNFPAPPPTSNYFVPQQQSTTAYPATVASETQKLETQNCGVGQSATGSLAQSGKTDFSQGASSHPVFDELPTAALDPSIAATQSPYRTSETQNQNLESVSLLAKLDNLAPSGAEYQETSVPAFGQQINRFPAIPPTNASYPPTTAKAISTPYIHSEFVFSGQQTTTSQLINPEQLNQGIGESTIKQIQVILGDSAQSSLHPSPAQRSSSNLSSLQQSPIGQPATEQITFFDPTKYLPPSSQTSISYHSSLTTSANKVPPPASGQISYRLQKGTKLYKNPLTPQETAPNPVAPNQIQQTLFSPQSVQLVTPPLSASAFFAPPPFGIDTLTTSLPNQTISLLTPFAENTNSHQTSKSIHPVSGQANFPLFVSTPPTTTTRQGVPFCASAVKEEKNNSTLQSISPDQVSLPLPVPSAIPFSARKTSVEETQGNASLQSAPSLLKSPEGEKLDINSKQQTSASFAPPIKKHKSEEPVFDVPKLAKLNDNANVSELEIKHEQKGRLVIQNGDPLESFEKHFLAHVSKPDSKPDSVDNTEVQPIFEPIEPVFEPNLSAVKEGVSVDPLEETLQQLSITADETKTAKLPPIGESFNLKNPYRKSSSAETAKPPPTLPALANFFTTEPSVTGSINSNFFSSLPSTQSNRNEVNFFSETGQLKEANKDNSATIKSSAEAEPINFFTKPFSSELAPLEPQTSVHPPISAFFPAGSAPAISVETNASKADLKEPFGQENLPPPRGFENIKQSDNTAELPSYTNIEEGNPTQTQQAEIVNRFSFFFNQTNQQQPEIAAKDPITFFDSISGSQQQQNQQGQHLGSKAALSSVATNEEQRIQYFFNNPPPKDASDVGDLNYDLVHSGLAIKHLQQRSLTPISNLVEPPSSACSEFSEISNSTAGQKSISAANLSIAEISDKSSETQELNKSVTEELAIGALETNIKRYGDLPEEVLKELRMANLLSADKTSTCPVASVSYKPAVMHWFFKRTVNDKQIWIPFSHYDSALLETSLLMEGDEKSNIVAVEGSRYDVNISERKKISVYWESPPIEVRRCSWFYKAVDSKYVPYEEETAEVLENEYKQAAESGVWHKTIVLGMGEQVVFHGPTVIVHFQQQQNADAWGGTTQTATRPRVVKRDLDDFNIEQGESQKVDHLLFMVHGIGSACDLKLRSVEEVVEDFRTIARQLVQSHYKNSTDLGLVGRVEVLPISWHSHLHSAEMGIDEKLRMITLESIPKLRNFTNDTLLDILFYTSPTFCQKIMNTIVSSMNSLYLKYRERHPEFNGGVSLAGHSLGSLILFDLLCHQNPIKESEEKNLENPDQFLAQMDSNQLEDKQMSYTMGPAGTGQPFIHYNQLIFQPKKFFALGSPIGMFVTIRGIDKLGLDFRLPTCPGFYNIFHPYDPVAYRIEALVNPDLSGVRPVLIPHHKGRKRMHLELKETMARVSMDLKNRFLDKFKTTLDSVNIFASSSKSTKEAEEMMEKEVEKVIQMQMQLEQQNHDDNLPSGSDCPNEPALKPRQRTDSVTTAMSDDAIEIDFPLGKLNDSKRIDYVLQEAPLEFINEYIFALSSHVCYWDSEDTILFVMKEIYSGLGISPDSQVPQQTMTIERPSSRNSLIS